LRDPELAPPDTAPLLGSIGDSRLKKADSPPPRSSVPRTPKRDELPVSLFSLYMRSSAAAVRLKAAGATSINPYKVTDD
jgi:hypothetical protein